MANQRKDWGDSQDVWEKAFWGTLSTSDFLDDLGQERALVAMDSYSAIGTVVTNVEEEINPPTAILIGVTIAVGSWTKTWASKKRSGQLVATKAALSEDT